MTDYFAGDVARRYDETSAAMFDPSVVDPAVDVLATLAGSGRALEFGIGTGRIALPLAARGVPVSGIELSEDMTAQLHAKAPGFDVTIGSFADARVEGEFALVYLVFNTIGNLTTQELQVACFRNAAEHLEPGGVFVIETGIPDLRSLPWGQTGVVFAMEDGHWGIDEYDVARQGLVSHHFERVDGDLRRNSLPFRYAFPAEFDLMAQLAGMRLQARWADWDRSEYTSESRKHISVWETPS